MLLFIAPLRLNCQGYKRGRSVIITSLLFLIYSNWIEFVQQTTYI